MLTKRGSGLSRREFVQLAGGGVVAGALVSDILSVDYHESIMAAAGKQADEVLAKAVAGKDYICVVEGGIPTVPGHGMIGGREMLEIAKEVCGSAVAVGAIGSCAVAGGVPAATPRPARP